MTKKYHLLLVLSVMQLYFTSYGVVTNCLGFKQDNGSIGPSGVTGGGDGATYTYTWSDGAVGTQRDSLKAGPYTLTVSTDTMERVSHTFYVRQPRTRVANPGTLGNPRPSRFSARNNWYIDEAPKSSVTPPVITTGSYSLSTQGITEGTTNSLFGVSNGVWHADNLAAENFTVGSSVTLSSSGIDLAADSSMLFGGGTWRLRYEDLNTELVFECLIDGVWVRRFIID